MPLGRLMMRVMSSHFELPFQPPPSHLVGSRPHPALYEADWEHLQKLLSGHTSINIYKAYVRVLTSVQSFVAPIRSVARLRGCQMNLGWLEPSLLAHLRHVEGDG